MSHKKKTKVSNKWNTEDRQNFADGNFLRAQTIPNKKKVSNRNACRDFRWNK